MKNDNYATLGFILSIVGFLTPFLGLFSLIAFNIPGLILSIIGGNKAENNKGLAIAGIIISSISILIQMILMFILISVIL